MQPRAVDFVSYNVSDLQRSVDFYRDTLGLSLVPDRPPEWPEFEVNGTTVALVAAAEMPKGAQMALAVPDVKAAVEELRAKGVTVIMDALETPVCHMATVADPDGNWIVLHQRKDGTAG
ncbi:MAG TPA: VOC family protein [Chloroflexota bacterium]|jgi:predicted enzyme related to lactoylglutathione lyase|nr:VOC family protein [Chloroflexota bacterium]